MIKYAQERLKQTREALKQKRDNMRNGRTHSGVTQLGVTADQLLCVRTAIAKREATILTAFNTFSASTSSGYTIRTMALNTAWTLTGTTDRKIAINAAWANWSSSMQIVNEVDKASLRGAWDTFKTEAQVCKVPEALTEGNRMSHEVGMGMRNN